jgi:hypothetical protein
VVEEFMIGHEDLLTFDFANQAELPLHTGQRPSWLRDAQLAESSSGGARLASGDLATGREPGTEREIPGLPFVFRAQGLDVAPIRSRRTGLVPHRRCQPMTAFGASRRTVDCQVWVGSRQPVSRARRPEAVVQFDVAGHLAPLVAFPAMPARRDTPSKEGQSTGSVPWCSRSGRLDLLRQQRLHDDANQQERRCHTQRRAKAHVRPAATWPTSIGTGGTSR